MSGSGNTEIVRSVYAAFERSDLDAVIDLLHDDVTWEFPGPSEIPYTGSYRGHAQVRAFFEDIVRYVAAEEFSVDRCIADGETVIVLGHERMRVKSTGRAFEMHWVDEFTLRHGKIVHFREYADTGAMLKAYLDLGER